MRRSTLLLTLTLAVGAAAVAAATGGDPEVLRRLAWGAARQVSPGLLRDIALTLTALCLVAFGGRRAKQALLVGLDDVTARHKTRKMVSWGQALATGLCLVLIWGRRVEGLGVFLGMIGAGLTLSVQESVLCLAGWLLILTRKPFDLGDRVEIGGHLGDVVDVRVFYTSLLEVGGWCAGEQSTGRIVHLPNSLFFRGASINYSQGFPFVWNEVTVVVTFESDWELAKEILLEWAQVEADKIETEVKRHLSSGQEKIPILYRRLSPIVYTTIADHGVALSLRHLSPIRARRGAIHSVSEHVLQRFAEEDGVELAYPTTRFFTPGPPARTPPGAATPEA